MLVEAVLAAGFAAGVIRERAYQAREQKLPLRQAVRHVAKGFATEAVFLAGKARALASRIRPKAEKAAEGMAAGAKETAENAVQLVTAVVEGAKSRAEALVPLSE